MAGSYVLLAQAAPPPSAAPRASTLSPPPSAPPGADFPPFDTQYWAPQIVWLAIIFAVLYLAMSRVALPRVEGILETRRKRIADDLQSADKARLNSEAASAEYDRLLADARARAQAEGHETHARLAAESEARRKVLERDLNEKLAAADRQIADTKSRAMSNVAAIAGETADVIVERLLGRKPNAQGLSRTAPETVES